MRFTTFLSLSFLVLTAAGLPTATVPTKRDMDLSGGWDNPPAFTSEAQAFDYAGALEEQDEEAESNGIGNAN